MPRDIIITRTIEGSIKGHTDDYSLKLERTRHGWEVRRPDGSVEAYRYMVDAVSMMLDE